jgi:hypothetical protein
MSNILDAIPAEARAVIVDELDRRNPPFSPSSVVHKSISYWRERSSTAWDQIGRPTNTAWRSNAL